MCVGAGRPEQRVHCKATTKLADSGPNWFVERRLAQMTKLCGYTGKILRVDLSTGKNWIEDLDDGILRKWVGGVGLGAKYLYEEVPPGIEWSDPRNRLIWSSGPLAGSGVFGAGTINIATKGPMTNIAGSSQANGFFGAYLKFSGFDGIVIQGRSSNPVYLVVRDGKAQIQDARHLAGKDIQRVEDDLRTELGVGEHDVKSYAIGPAGGTGSCTLSLQETVAMWPPTTA